MSTGYTSLIENGITFKDFTLKCARAFGACVTMRDEPFNRPIPDKFEPSEYHREELEKYKLNLENIKDISIEDAKIKAEKEYNDAKTNYITSLKEKFSLKEKYELMLKQVKNWQPPTKDHKELKNFMIQQIESSINFDCNVSYTIQPKLKSPEEWLNGEINKCLKSIDYHLEQYNKEVNNCKERTEWIQALKKSLE